MVTTPRALELTDRVRELVAGALAVLQPAPAADPRDLDCTLHALRRQIARSMPYFLGALALVAETDYILTVSVRLARRFATAFGLRVVAPPRARAGTVCSRSAPASAQRS